MAISGIGLVTNEENVDEASLTELLKKINDENKSIVEAEERERTEEMERIQNEKLKEAQAEEDEKNKARFDKEQEEKKAREERERQEAEEAENIKKRNPFYSVVKKMEQNAPKENDSEEESSKRESYGEYFIRTSLERGGDAYRIAKETLAEKKHNITKAIALKVSKIGGFEAPEIGEYDASEDYEKRKEAKRIKKEAQEEQRKIKKEEAEEKRKIKQEEAEKKRMENEAKKAAALEEKKKKEEELREQRQRAKEEKALAAERKRERTRPSRQVPPPVFPQEPNSPTGTQPNTRGALAQEPREEISNEEYNNGLDKESRALKQMVVKEHIVPDFLITERAVNEIQKMRDVISIVIASRDMNDLFIFHEPMNFIQVAEQLDNELDYSYIYIITTTAPIYFGADRCYHDITELFNRIREAFLTQYHVDKALLLKIPGINIFKNIYLDC